MMTRHLNFIPDGNPTHDATLLAARLKIHESGQRLREIPLVHAVEIARAVRQHAARTYQKDKVHATTQRSSTIRWHVEATDKLGLTILTPCQE